jgi:aerobic-type carbon monoxide dehydrogenase small subunit (CoxS/CutS family)
MSERFVRVGETERATVRLFADGQPIAAQAGDTLAVALLVHQGHLRHSEFGDGVRAGFCLMGACQECWVWTEDGERLRSCTTVVRDGLRILTRLPETSWPNPA